MDKIVTKQEGDWKVTYSPHRNNVQMAVEREMSGFKIKARIGSDGQANNDLHEASGAGSKCIGISVDNKEMYSDAANDFRKSEADAYKNAYMGAMINKIAVSFGKTLVKPRGSYLGDVDYELNVKEIEQITNSLGDQTVHSFVLNNFKKLNEEIMSEIGTPDTYKKVSAVIGKHTARATATHDERGRPLGLQG